MRECECRIPIAHPSPYKKHTCVKCGFWINPRWTSNDETVARFYDSLARAQFHRDKLTKRLLIPDDFTVFRAEAEARERAGRDYFGLRFLGRENTRDAREEAGDGANYFLFDHLQYIRHHDEDEDIDEVLTGAYHAYKTYESARRLRLKRQGSP